MNHSRKLNNKFNKIRKLAFRIIYRDEKSVFDKLLEKGKSVKIHIKKVQVFVTSNYEQSISYCRTKPYSWK